MNDLRETTQHEVTQARDVEAGVAEIQSAMVIAQKFPRKVAQARHDIINACARPRLAETALYEYAKGGTAVKGPSIRLAEVLAQNWGNMSFGLRELVNRPRVGDKWGESQVQAYCWDMQSNTKREITFSVPHIRVTRTGTKVLEDPRDIYELIANQGARRMRACILAIIPGDIIEEAVEAIESTLTTNVKMTAERLEKCLINFKAFGVSKSQIEAFIQRRFEAIQPTQFVTLGRIYNSINDGLSTPNEWFSPDEESDQGDAAPTSSRSDSVKNKLLDAKRKPAPSEPQDDDVITDSAEISLSMFRDFNAAIGAAASIEEIEAIETDIGLAAEIGTRDRVILLNALIEAKANTAPQEE